jgi:hypothetical protein
VADRVGIDFLDLESDRRLKIIRFYVGGQESESFARVDHGSGERQFEADAASFDSFGELGGDAQASGLLQILGPEL